MRSRKMVEGEAGRRTGSMIPPVARRKLMMRELNSRREARRNVLAGSLVALFIIIFVVYNIQYIRDLKTKRQVFEGSRAGDTVSVASSTNADNSGRLRGTHSWISAHSQPFNLNDSATNAKHLIMVAGHSVTVSGHLEDAGKDEGDWFLLSYQKGKGLPQAIEGHIRAGIEEANKDPESLLVFSGGETRPITGPLSEGSSYFHVSDAMGLWPTGSTVRARTITEEFATDSFENLLFSICRFREVTGRYPEMITVVSFSFKQRRFQELHAPALGWPADRFKYVGFNPPASTGFDLQSSTEGEQQNAAKPFENDPYGCNSPILQQKRKERNPYSRTPPYQLSCPEMKELLKYCGPELFTKELLPWNK